MKTLVKAKLLFVAALLFTLFSANASADHRSHRRDWGYDDHHRYSRNHYRDYPRSRDYFSISYGSSHGRHYSRHDHFNSGSFIGGLVLGSVLTGYSAPRYESRNYSSRTVPVSRSITVIHRDSGQSIREVPSRRLFKDLQGSCYERIMENGNEVMVELEASACNF